jgi:hypothetical protein
VIANGGERAETFRALDKDQQDVEKSTDYGAAITCSINILR